MQQGHPRMPSKLADRASSSMPNGTIVTNNHVVKNATSVTVTLDDGTTLPAQASSAGIRRSDLAVLRVKADHQACPSSIWATPTRLSRAAWVVAVGNPFGLGGTVTAGIVSARGRDIGEGPYDNFIQIDAPINHGQFRWAAVYAGRQGGGCEHRHDLSPNGGGSVGIGFAIPSNTVKSVVAQLGEIRPRDARLYRRFGPGRYPVHGNSPASARGCRR